MAFILQVLILLGRKVGGLLEIKLREESASCPLAY